jgi:hypothetical protein
MKKVGGIINTKVVAYKSKKIAEGKILEALLHSIFDIIPYVTTLFFFPLLFTPRSL